MYSLVDTSLRIQVLYFRDNIHSITAYGLLVCDAKPLCWGVLSSMDSFLYQNKIHMATIRFAFEMLTRIARMMLHIILVTSIVAGNYY